MWPPGRGRETGLLGGWQIMPPSPWRSRDRAPPPAPAGGAVPRVVARGGARQGWQEARTPTFTTVTMPSLVTGSVRMLKCPEGSPLMMR